MVSAPARRQQVTYAMHRGVSERRACALMSVARSALHYEFRLRAKDAPALSAQYPRYGYRRVNVFLERQGHQMSVDRARRLWRDGGFQVPKKRSRKRIALAAPGRKRRLQPGRFGRTTSSSTPAPMASRPSAGR